MISRKQWVVFSVLLLILILVLLHRYPPSAYINHDSLNELVSRLGWLGVAGFIVGGSVFTAIGFPRQLVAFVSGYIFGAVFGAVIGGAAAIIGCFMCYVFSRRFLRSLVLLRYAGTVSMLNRFITDDAFLKIIILRLQPFGTNLITNLSAGVSHIPARVFIASSLVGYMPQTIVFALIGSGVRVDSSAQMVVSVILFTVSVLTGLYLYLFRRVN